MNHKAILVGLTMMLLLATSWNLRATAESTGITEDSHHDKEMVRGEKKDIPPAGLQGAKRLCTGTFTPTKPEWFAFNLANPDSHQIVAKLTISLNGEYYLNAIENVSDSIGPAAIFMHVGVHQEVLQKAKTKCEELKRLNQNRVDELWGPLDSKEQDSEDKTVRTYHLVLKDHDANKNFYISLIFEKALLAAYRVTSDSETKINSDWHRF